MRRDFDKVAFRDANRDFPPSFKDSIDHEEELFAGLERLSKYVDFSFMVLVIHCLLAVRSVGAAVVSDRLATHAAIPASRGCR